MKGQRFRQPICRLPSLLVLVVTLAFELTTGGAPLAAQQPLPPDGVRPGYEEPVMPLAEAVEWAPSPTISSTDAEVDSPKEASIAAVLATATQVVAGGGHTCALTIGGGVMCWGWNYSGELGDGTTTDRSMPVAVSGLSSGVTAIAAGYEYTCALTAGGGVKCWGDNRSGQLGDGTTTDRSMPAAVSGLDSGVTAIAAGNEHTCALTANGGAKCWGDNRSGQLGDGTATTRYIPVAVSGLSSGVVAVTAGNAHTCALTTGGGVKCWGDNRSGQLGDGTTTDRSMPTAVSGLGSGATAIAAGTYHTCALTAGGGVMCWGWNGSGQLGVNPGWTPVDVVGFGPATYTISGRVTEAGGFTGIPGVTVWADATRNTTTDANGNYTFTGLPAGTYTIRPEKAPYAFSPPSRTVTVPADQTGVDFRSIAITRVQVNQVLGNTTNYVAGKDTVIQVMLSDYVRYDPANQQVVVKKDGAYVTTLKPLKPAFPTQTLNFWGKMEDCRNWQQGSYTFEATVNGSQMIKGGLQFYNRRTLRVLAVPVSVGLGTETRMPRDVWKHANQFLRQTYPVAKDGVIYDRSLLTLPAGLFNLTSANDRKLLWNSLKLYQPLLCGLPGRPPCYDAIVGVLPYIQLGDLMGWTYGSPVTLVIEPESDAEAEELQATIAHELGHIVGGLGDEYGHTAGLPNLGGNFQCNINPPPKDYCGRNGTASCGTGATRCPLSPAVAWVGPRPGGGSAVRAQVDSPFEVGGRNGLGDKLSFMGGAGAGTANYWVTPAVYDHLFWDLPPSASQVSAASLTTERVANVSGEVGLDGHAILNPAYHLVSAAPSMTTGDYTVEVLDAQGALLSSQGFSISFLGLSNPPQDLSEAPFDVAIRFPVDTRTIRVKHGANILTEMTVSAHAPTLSLTSPIAGQTWAATGNYTIRWQGSDLDGNTLHYTVLYRQGAGDWIVLGADLTANELTANAAGLPGGTAAQVQVLATDGINTTTAESGLFTVGRKGPEAFITYPTEGASFMPGVSFFLQGTAYDLEDGTLPDPAYRWTSDRDDDLGTGASNLVILSPGPHVITLTVTDSDGNATVKTIQISAGDRLFLPTVLRGN